MKIRQAVDKAEEEKKSLEREIDQKRAEGLKAWGEYLKSSPRQ